MSVQVDPMAAVAAALSSAGAFPTILPQWCLPPREPPPHVATAAAHRHPESMAGLVDQPLDLSAKPKNSQVYA